VRSTPRSWGFGEENEKVMRIEIGTVEVCIKWDGLSGCAQEIGRVVESGEHENERTCVDCVTVIGNDEDESEIEKTNVNGSLIEHKHGKETRNENGVEVATVTTTGSECVDETKEKNDFDDELRNALTNGEKSETKRLKASPKSTSDDDDDETCVWSALLPHVVIDARVLRPISAALRVCVCVPLLRDVNLIRILPMSSGRGQKHRSIHFHYDIRR